MPQFLTDLSSSPWVQGVGIGLLVLFIGWVARKFFSTNQDEVAPQHPRNNQSTVITTNIYPSPTLVAQENLQRQALDSDVPRLKQSMRILFIEDGTFKQISNLRRAGWRVEQMKDVVNLDSAQIRDSQIIFVDYKDVGKAYSDEEGLGVVRGLKERYGSSKWVVLYSAHPQSLGVVDYSADSYLEKNSPLIDIEQKIIEGARRLAV